VQKDRQTHTHTWTDTGKTISTLQAWFIGLCAGSYQSSTIFTAYTQQLPELLFHLLVPILNC